MGEWLALILGVAVGFAVRSILVHRTPPRPPQTPEEPAADGRRRLYQVAEEIGRYFQQTAHPSDLLRHEVFEQGVALLRAGEFSTDELLAYATGDNQPIACMALEALARRDDDADVVDRIFALLNGVPYWARFFALRVLDTRVKPPVVARLLLGIDESWSSGLALQLLGDFVRRRLDAGEPPTVANWPDALVESHVDFLERFLDQLGLEAARPLLAELRAWRRRRLNLGFLRSCGRLLEESAAADPGIVMQDVLLERVATIGRALKKRPPRSVLVTGADGVGKKTIVQTLARRLIAEGWTLFQAGAAELKAGQIWIGQLEERLQNLLANLRGKDKVLWVVPSFQELVWAGRHQYSQISILDTILPFLESGEIRVLGCIEPGGLEHLLQTKPGLKSVMDVVEVAALGEAQTLELARAWIGRQSREDHPPLLGEKTLREAFQLARQYLLDQANPGGLLDFLKLTLQARSPERGAGVDPPITTDELLATLSRRTGLPPAILDERLDLDLEALRAFFHQRVIGQPEAANCLVERVAMIKAGVTDPTRPLGVFLFTGPTGTGKTEIARTLAEYLFGSPERMIRLDMSEFQTGDALARILGSPLPSSEQTALVNQIRKQPFSVLLLDEFEKAHPSVWDLFLQVFDDGRLTDRQGATADFRHAIVILTSNLASDPRLAGSIGFRAGSAADVPTREELDRVLATVFRREFLNRLDRVVPFRPLGRAVMREVLAKELDRVFQRRGLRNREWAVEWDESALEFLLNHGFSAVYGARPLQRAIERYLLSPLAMTIVNHQVPEGEQFLFVRAGTAGIEVAFVDPDAEPAAPEAEPLPASDAARTPQLEGIVMDAHGSATEVDFLGQVYEELRAAIEDDAWKQAKARALAAISNPVFWTSSERFAVLGRAEYMDRIEAGVKTAGSLLQRLAGREPGSRRTFAADIVRRLAEQLYLLQAATEGLRAAEPPDAFLRVTAIHATASEAGAANAFATRLGAMYRAWAAKRGMTLEALEEEGGSDGRPYRFTAAVSGFAACSLLAHEAGIHVLEVGAGRQTRRHKVRVDVAPQPPEPAGPAPGALLAQARAALGRDRADRSRIVRRYREDPSPLVRDSQRGWRTGRFDLVLAGDFDLFR
ncbi:MAG: AAA family ATPase [Planctomycetes bacterium]|nr:AAA family ATPase [Planctomycetota bacterium]